MDEIDGSFFDHIDDLLDFPTEDIDSVLPLMGKPESILPSIWTETLPGSDSVFTGGAASSSDLSAELSIPYEDIVQLEWLSTFVEDSFSGGSLAMTAVALHDDPPKNDRQLSTFVEDSFSGGSLAMTAVALHDVPPKNDGQFHTSSPVSVLDSSSSSSSCSSEKTAPNSPDAVVPGKYGRARSKRPRPASFNPRPTMIQLVSSPYCSISEDENQGMVPLKSPGDPSENFTESYPAMKALKEAATGEPKKKKKKIKLTLPPRPSATDAEDEDHGSTQAPVRKCLHCEITKTPQWRAGPLGPKSLCNACGVRYKSGRLFPEYRPAASPTFIPLLHSNSHKKVLEMRGITGEKPILGTELINGQVIKDTPELIPNPTVVQMNYM